MKEHNLEKLKSIQSFKETIGRTYLFIHSLRSAISATEEVLEFTHAKENPGYKKFEKSLEFDESRKAYLYELGFIALFSNFEFFMSNFLKELFLKYPSSLKSEKMIRLEEINDFKDVKELKEYFIDLVAIEKSYDVKSWLGCLSQKFNIEVFTTKKSLQRFLMLNSLRNLYMHAEAVTNSKFRNEMKNFLKTKIPLGQKISLDRRKYFEVLYHELNFIVENLNKN